MSTFDTTSYLLQHIASTLYRRLDQILLERLGIGLAQYKLLMLLRDLPPGGQRQLANHLGQTEASISRQLKLLTAKDFVTVTTSPTSKREHSVDLTAKGLKMTEAAAEVLAREDEVLVEHLSPKQRDQLTTILDTLHSDVCGSGKPFACNHAASPVL